MAVWLDEQRYTNANNSKLLVASRKGYNVSLVDMQSRVVIFDRYIAGPEFPLTLPAPREEYYSYSTKDFTTADIGIYLRNLPRR